MAEDHPDLWRDMASAFVENQLWHTSFNTLASGDLNQQPTKSATSKPAATLKPSTRPSLERFNRSNWLSLAAGILIALSGIWIVNRFEESVSPIDSAGTMIASTPDSRNQPAVLDSPAVVNAGVGEMAPKPAYSITEYNRPVQFELMDPNGNSVMESEVPLYDIETAQKAGFPFQKQRQLPTDVVNRLRRGGYWVNQDTDFYSGKTRDGSRVVFPVQTIRLTPGQ